RARSLGSSVPWAPMWISPPEIWAPIACVAPAANRPPVDARRVVQAGDPAGDRARAGGVCPGPRRRMAVDRPPVARGPDRRGRTGRELRDRPRRRPGMDGTGGRVPRALTGRTRRAGARLGGADRSNP